MSPGAPDLNILNSYGLRLDEVVCLTTPRPWMAPVPVEWSNTTGRAIHSGKGSHTQACSRTKERCTSATAGQGWRLANRQPINFAVQATVDTDPTSWD
ncbi:hypothetical protein TruAng_009244 [Truncatella angustata]|nr:hypothetical protein TruAng_009244 [Truncatella angustata]